MLVRSIGTSTTLSHLHNLHCLAAERTAITEVFSFSPFWLHSNMCITEGIMAALSSEEGSGDKIYIPRGEGSKISQNILTLKG